MEVHNQENTILLGIIKLHQDVGSHHLFLQSISTQFKKKSDAEKSDVDVIITSLIFTENSVWSVRFASVFLHAFSRQKLSSLGHVLQSRDRLY